MYFHILINIMQRYILVLCLSLYAVFGFAKDEVVVEGKVVDVLTNSPVVDATIKVFNAVDSSYVTVAKSNMGYGEVVGDRPTENFTYTGQYRVVLPRGKYIFAVSCVGYDDTDITVDLTTLKKREFATDVPAVYLRRESKKLGEVVVTASKVKFYHKGDTLVFNADAFQLAEGSMLDALIQQLPGVELRDDGEIYVNGQYVEELLLNGKHFFDNNKQFMLQNLGAYTVKDVQVYNKRSRLSELAGADLDRGSFVMDVKMKREFMGGTILNVEGGYGSENRCLGRLFGMLFTATGQYVAYFNANNLNDSRKPGQQTSWTPDKMPTGVRKTISGGFDYNIKTLDKHWELSGNVNGVTTRETDGTDIVRANYLVDGNTYDYGFNRSRNKSWTLGTKHKFYYKTKGGYGIAMEPFFKYDNWNYWGEDVNATFGEKYNDMSTDFVQNIYGGGSTGALASLINRNVAMNRQKGHSVSTGAVLWQGIKIPGTNDMLVVNLVGKYDNRHDERFNHYDINFGQDPVPARTANRYFKNYPAFNSSLSGEVGYTSTLAKNMHLAFSYRYDHIYGKETSDLYQLGSLDDIDRFMLGKLPSAIDYELSLDRNNSFLSRNTEDNHKFTLSYVYGGMGSDVWIQVSIPVTLSNRKLDYRRAAVDTTVTRSSAVFDIGDTFFSLKTGKNSNLQWNLGLKSRVPDLVSMVDITDDTDPLYIRKGNGKLKNALIFDTSLSYNYKNIWMRAHYTATSNAISQGYTYDTATGIREGRYYNVNGNWSVDGALDWFKQTKGFTLRNSLSSAYVTSVDLMGQDSPQLVRSKVYNLWFSDNAYMSYRFGKSELGVNVSVRHDRFTSNLANFTNQNTWTVKSGLNATLELPANFQLATDFTVYNRRGYTDAALNTDNFVWNARLTYRALKGKLLLMLDGYDMLHDLSNVSYTINAQARTEVYRTVLPRYFMFHVQWRFNSNPKRKQ